MFLVHGNFEKGLGWAHSCTLNAVVLTKSASGVENRFLPQKQLFVLYVWVRA
jgi:hypothetical protein